MVCLIIHHLFLLSRGRCLFCTIIKTIWGEIDLRKNKEFGLKCLEENQEDFIFWKFYLDIEPMKVDEKEYIRGISNLIMNLKEKSIRAVPSCDFEDDIWYIIGKRISK